MRLEWARPALSDIKDAGDFISSDNPRAAERMAERMGMRDIGKSMNTDYLILDRWAFSKIFFKASTKLKSVFRSISDFVIDLRGIG